jgi:hypothetical protein
VLASACAQSLTHAEIASTRVNIDGLVVAEPWIHRTSMSCAQKVPRLNLADAAATPPPRFGLDGAGMTRLRQTS